jgi:ribosomal-protein-alanine N-acetyltransferase
MPSILAILGRRLHRIEAGTLAHNAASQRVLEHNGFVRFGLAPKHLKIAGKWQDHIMFQRLAFDGE